MVVHRPTDDIPGCDHNDHNLHPFVLETFAPELSFYYCVVDYHNSKYHYKCYFMFQILMIKSIEVIFMHRDLQYVDLLTNSINPKVLTSYLYTQGLTMPKGHRLPKRFVYDYELEFFTESDGEMYIEDQLYPIQKGDLVFRRPGQSTQAIMPYCCYLISFDLTGTTHKRPEDYHFCTETNNQFQTYYRNPLLDPIPNVFHPHSPEKYLRLFDLVLKEFIHPSDNSALLQTAYTIQILCQLSQDVRNPMNHNAVLDSPHGKVVKKTLEYIQTHISSPLRLGDLAKLAGFSPTYFHKIFHDTTGIPLNEYITTLRIDLAKNLLVRTNLPIYRIAQDCGFENIPYFSSLFKKHEKISPAEFRKKYNYIN